MVRDRTSRAPTLGFWICGIRLRDDIFCLQIVHLIIREIKQEGQNANQSKGGRGEVRADSEEYLAMDEMEAPKDKRRSGNACRSSE